MENKDTKEAIANGSVFLKELTNKTSNDEKIKMEYDEDYN